MKKLKGNIRKNKTIEAINNAHEESNLLLSEAFESIWFEEEENSNYIPFKEKVSKELSRKNADLKALLAKSDLDDPARYHGLFNSKSGLRIVNEIETTDELRAYCKTMDVEQGDILGLINSKSGPSGLANFPSLLAIGIWCQNIQEDLNRNIKVMKKHQDCAKLALSNFKNYEAFNRGRAFTKKVRCGIVTERKRGRKHSDHLIKFIEGNTF